MALDFSSGKITEVESRDESEGRGSGALVVVGLASGETVDRNLARSPVTFSYVPGLLSFRELPVLASAPRYRILEPIRRADRLVGKLRAGEPPE